MLTSCQRRFVLRCQETEDPAARVAAWRECGLPDAADETVRAKARELLERADAQAYAQAQQGRLAILEQARERAQQQQADEKQAVAREIWMSSLEDAYEVLRFEKKQVMEGARKSVQGYSRLLGQVDAMTKDAPAGDGLSQGEARAKWVEAREKAQAAKPAPAPAAESAEPVFIALSQRVGNA